MIDNQPKTTSEKQVISNVFGECKSYPNISTDTKEDVTTLERLNESSEPVVRKKKIKRKIEHEKPLAKKQIKQASEKNKEKKKRKQKNKQRRRTTAFTYNRELCDNSYHLYDI